MTRLGVLCVHGLGGTPHSVLPLTAAIHGAGYTTVAPRLLGHGGSPEDLIDCEWNDWVSELDEIADDLASRTSSLVIVGQSMGATLALQLAADRTDVRAVAAINP